MVWKKTWRTNRRFKEWVKTKTGDVVTVEIPPSGWKVWISLDKGETSHSFKTQTKAIAFANRYMKTHSSRKKSMGKVV